MRPYEVVKRGSGNQPVATTMAFVRLLKELIKDKEIGYRFVPIIPDEARTFGMDSLFPTPKIYSPHGQSYLSVDRDMVLSYKESETGVILHEGINEAGSVASFTAVGTSYATHGEPMIPIYVFYSMFGFQRTGDGFWAAGDQMARGFVLGATAGRTTLNGEGLQHEDGHSPLLASTNPAVVHYDPAFGYEVGHIVRDGLRRMYGDQPEDIYYYLTIYNEPYVQPAEPEVSDVDSLLRGMYLYSGGGRRPEGAAAGSGARVGGRAAVGVCGRPSCCATTGACTSTSGRSRRGTSCAATASRSTTGTCSIPGRGGDVRRSSPGSWTADRGR